MTKAKDGHAGGENFWGQKETLLAWVEETTA